MYGDDAEVVRYTIAVVEVICYNSLKKNINRLQKLEKIELLLEVLAKFRLKTTVGQYKFRPYFS